jgi:pyruvate/2-oxoglutarate dehydrogenase complex dihydrolipoamide acyltransferase (E2) component
MKLQRVDVLLPDLGDVEDVVVVAWLRSIGEVVAEGDDLVEVETEKTTFVVPAPVAGRLERTEAGVGKRVRIGERLGEISAG